METSPVSGRSLLGPMENGIPEYTSDEKKMEPSGQHSFQIGDIVLVVDERTSRNLWPLARGIDITPNSMGLLHQPSNVQL
jgi:hypothetical protein